LSIVEASVLEASVVLVVLGPGVVHPASPTETTTAAAASTARVLLMAESATVDKRTASIGVGVQGWDLLLTNHNIMGIMMWIWTHP
jgi:hypothetical protein